MSDRAPHPVVDLDTIRAARAAETERLDGFRPFIVTLYVSAVAVVPPNADFDMHPQSEVLDAADLVDDPGRLGDIARGMVARLMKEGSHHAD